MTGVLVWEGPYPAETELADVTLRVASDIWMATFTAEDLDGDGVSDLVVGSMDDSTGGADAGALGVFPGPVSATAFGDAASTWTGEAANDEAGTELSTGDVDGDGYVDILAVAPGDATGGKNGGAVYVLAGPIATGTHSLADATAKVYGTGADDWQCIRAAGGGDIDDDGADDLLIGRCMDDTGATDAGLVALVQGPVVGIAELTTVSTAWYGAVASDHAGAAVYGLGDLDGDGYDDFAYAAPGSDVGATDAGEVRIVGGGIF